MDNSQLIRLENVHVNLRHAGFCQEVLRDVDFTLKQGEHVAILGANGSGKSTFLRVLCGETWISHGAITWYMQGRAEQSPIMGRRMAALVSHAKQENYVRHEWRLSGEDILLTAFSASASEQLLYFIPDAEQKNAVKLMAERLNCTHLLHQAACTLSQGQLRLLLLGRALLRSPQVLLLDEYLDGLDGAQRAHILKILQDCPCSMVLSDHRANAIPPWIEHVYNLEQGSLRAKPAQSFSTYSSPAEQSRADAGNAKDDNRPNVSTSDDVFIDIQNATVFIERKAILQNISWTWRAGEHWRLLGANGSGKSTFLHLLAGDEHVAFDGGTIQRNFLRHEPMGENVTELAHIRRSIGLLGAKQQQTYAYDVNGLECVLSGLDSVQGVYRHYEEHEIAKAQALLRRFKLQSLENRHIRSLSTGQLRRILLARLFMGDAQLLLLDEPFSGLDQTSYFAMRNILEEETLHGHVHIILVSHYEEDTLACINRYARFHVGTICDY